MLFQIPLYVLRVITRILLIFACFFGKRSKVNSRKSRVDSFTTSKELRGHSEVCKIRECKTDFVFEAIESKCEDFKIHSAFKDIHKLHNLSTTMFRMFISTFGVRFHCETVAFPYRHFYVSFHSTL